MPKRVAAKFHCRQHPRNAIAVPIEMGEGIDRVHRSINSPVKRISVGADSAEEPG